MNPHVIEISPTFAMIDVHDDPVTVWIEQLKKGDSEAAQQLWEHFFNRLHAVAKTRIAMISNRVYDEEDAAQSAFFSFCNGIAAGRFPNLQDRDSLWRLLVTITFRKISGRLKYEHGQKRNARRRVNDSSDGLVGNMETLEPSPEFVVQAKETLEHLIERLADEKLRRICCLKLEGYRDDEIAEKMDTSRRTIQRKVERIRKTWSSLSPDKPGNNGKGVQT